jgi:Ran GTPase-activating protein (RanGAP) involved in mRNA processing and transport
MLIISLCLEWNALGLWESAMLGLAESIGSNVALQKLDLRNNKMGPSTIRSLRQALKGNQTLRKLGISIY